MISKKNKGLIVNIILYAVAFLIGLIPFVMIDEIFFATLIFTVVATFVIYIVSVFYKDTSLYDPYWSVAPPVLLLADMIKYHLWNKNSIIIFIVVMIWAVRLTGNWYIIYRGIGFEDWRYAMFRKKFHPFLFELINFFGLQYVPTLFVYAGLTSAILLIQNTTFTPLVFIGAAVSLFGVLLEIFADHAVHDFLKKENKKHLTCNISVWKYSRHPNYLGEMTFWTGLFISYALSIPEKWYYGLGFLLIIFLFCAVSVPMMEKHNMERRSDYSEYKKHTSVLLLLPPKK